MIPLNSVLNEDCLATMGRMPDNFIDLTVTSPPYDNLRTYNGYCFDFENVARQLYRVTKNGGIVVWVVGDATMKGSETLTSFRQALFFKEIGFNVHDTMIYGKNSYIPLSHNRYEQQFEYMFILSKGKPSTVNHIRIASQTAGSKKNRRKGKEQGQGMRFREEVTLVNETKIKGNIWFYNVGENDKTPHPAVFPEQLAYDHIYSWSNEGDVVYDPFGGSGTTAKMARALQRHYILSEISPDYCTIIRKRLAESCQGKRFQEAIREPLFDQTPIKLEQGSIFG